MNEKAKRFAAWLMETHNMKGITIEPAGDAQHTIIFRTELPVGEKTLPLGILLDDTIYALIRVNFATKALDDTNAFAVQQFLARRNYEDKFFKYYLAPDTTILLDACVPQPASDFRPAFLWHCAAAVAQEARRQAEEIFERVGRA